MALFSESITIALSMLFGLVLLLVLRYYEHIRFLSEEYGRSNEAVGTIVLGFKGEFERLKLGLDELENEIALLKSTGAVSRDLGQDNSWISEVRDLKKRIDEIEMASEFSTTDIEAIKKTLENLGREQERVRRQIEVLGEQYRGLLPETEAKSMAPMASYATLSDLHPTEAQILSMLITEGPMSATEIQEGIDKTREHTARLMKKLYDGNMVDRDQKKRPYIYTASNKVKQSIKKAAEEKGATETSSE